MTDPIPQVPATLCGLYPGAQVRWDRPIFKRTRGTVEAITSGGVWIRYSQAHGPLVTRVEGLHLLLDGWQPMCHAARWLAGRLGMEPGSTAPGWAFVPADDDGMAPLTPAHFRLVGPDWVRVFTEEDGFNAQYFFGDPRPILRQTRNDAGVEAYEVHPWRPTTVPGILAMGPAEALAAACMALAPA